MLMLKFDQPGKQNWYWLPLLLAKSPTSPLWPRMKLRLFGNSFDVFG